MLVICAGPDGFRARLKYRDLIDAYRKKYDEKGGTVERLPSENLYEAVMSKLGNQSLFASKKLLVCEGLMSRLTAKQAQNLRNAIYRDGDITVVIDYETKAPKTTAVKFFQEKEVFIYEHEPAKGAELNRIVADLCKRYGVSVKLVSSLIQRYQSDLWAIDTALQVTRVWDEQVVESGVTKLDNMYALVDWLLMDQKKWLAHYNDFDINSILSSSLSQMRTWHMLKEGMAKGAHPFVQKKLGAMKINNADERLQEFLCALYASRHSLAHGDEMVQLLY